MEDNNKIDFVFRNHNKWRNLIEADENYINGKKLSVRGKDLKTLDHGLFARDLHLTLLELSPDYQSCLNYKLEFVPKTIGNMLHLRELKLDTNDLRVIPNELGKLANLERLSLSNNKLRTLPDTLSNLKNLKSLHLSSNQFDKIPQCIVLMPKLAYLDFTSNKLKKLDKSLTKLKDTLKYLYVYDNQIDEIELWIDDLHNLEQFWFGKNEIKSVPYDLTKIRRLDWADNYFSIILDHNPIEKPPLDVCKKGFSAIRKWYESNNHNGNMNKTSRSDNYYESHDIYRHHNNLHKN